MNDDIAGVTTHRDKEARRHSFFVVISSTLSLCQVQSTTWLGRGEWQPRDSSVVTSTAQNTASSRRCLRRHSRRFLAGSSRRPAAVGARTRTSCWCWAVALRARPSPTSSRRSSAEEMWPSSSRARWGDILLFPSSVGKNTAMCLANTACSSGQLPQYNILNNPCVEIELL